MGIKSEPQELSQESFTHPESMSVNLPEEGLEHRMPDLLSFGPIGNTSTWIGTIKNMELQFLGDTPLMIWGGSNKLFKAIHDYSHLGKVAYQPSFVPTVAYLENLKMVSLKLPARAESHHSSSRDAAAIYSNFYSSENKCTHSILLHPIKLKEPFWEAYRSQLDDLLQSQ